MADSKPGMTPPLPTGFNSVPATDDELADGATRSTLRWSALSSSKWNMTHVHATRRFLQYLRGTSELSTLSTSSKRLILGYADVDWGGCLDTRRSTTCYLFRTFGALWLGILDDKLQQHCELPKPNTWYQMTQPGMRSGFVSPWKTLDMDWMDH
jgi:hypothetical protein